MLVLLEAIAGAVRDLSRLPEDRGPRGEAELRPDRFYGGAMTDFVEQDLSGAHFERVNLRHARFDQVRLNDTTMRAVDLSLPVFRASLRAKQITEQARAKARDAITLPTSDVTARPLSASESLPSDCGR